MSAEIRSPRVGMLRVTDVVAVFGRAIATRTSVCVLVLAKEAGAPFIGDVTLVRKRSGRAAHVALECPSCHLGRQILLLAAERGLECRDCGRRRTLHQSQHTLTWWKDHGGREHDQILRLVTGLGRKPAGAYRRAQRLVDELLRADADRLAALRERAYTALIAADSILAEKPITRDETIRLLIEEGLSAGMGPTVGLIVAEHSSFIRTASPPTPPLPLAADVGVIHRDHDSVDV
jgi:hypothetical protein